MKYVALLRGINVGGNNIIKMVDLKECFEKAGYENVSTYIQSGNVLFESMEQSTPKLEEKLEALLSMEFDYESTVLVRSLLQLQKVVDEVPNDWNKRDDIRCYIAFVKQPLPSAEVAAQIEPKKGIDVVDVGDGVVYMTTLMSGLTKSNISKIIRKKIYKQVTMRNYNTTRNILNKLTQ